MTIHSMPESESEPESDSRNFVAVANCISGPAHFDTWIKDSFISAFATLNGVPGIREFHLRRLSGSHDHCLFISITRWDHIRHFHRWRTSEEFVTAHPNRRDYEWEFRQMHNIRYNIPVPTETPIGHLDADILRRLSADHPALVPAGAEMVGEIHWLHE